MKQKHEQEHSEGLLVGVAKKIGHAAGKIAGIAHHAPAKATGSGKLPPKNKARLPRRVKKARKRAAKALVNTV